MLTVTGRCCVRLHHKILPMLTLRVHVIVSITLTYASVSVRPGCVCKRHECLRCTPLTHMNSLCRVLREPVSSCTAVSLMPFGTADVLPRCPRHGTCDVFVADYYCVKCERKSLVSQIRHGERLPPPTRLRKLLLTLHEDDEADADEQAVSGSGRMVSESESPTRAGPARVGGTWKQKLGTCQLYLRELVGCVPGVTGRA